MIISLGIWEEEDNIAIDIYIPCVIYIDIPSTGLAKKNDVASEAEGDLEPESELSSDERRYAKVVEVEVVEFVDDTANYEEEGIFESPLSKKRGSGIGRAEMWGDINESLEKIERHQFIFLENEEDFYMSFL